MTPGGMPAPLTSLQRARALSGVFSLVFITMVQPVARAGAHFHASIRIGKFHGMIWL